MRERGDLAVVHEPFLYEYYIVRKTRYFPHFEPDPGHPQNYADTRDHLIGLAEAGPVFAKDQAYYALDHLLADEGFLRRVHHAFLIRDPKAAIASYHRKDPEMLCEEIGIESQLRLHDRLMELGIEAPILRTEAVQSDAAGQIGRWWSAAGLASAPHAFDWQAKEVTDWQFVDGWHGRVQSSRGIEKTRADPGAFDRAASAAPHLTTYLDRHQAAYDTLVERAL